MAHEITSWRTLILDWLYNLAETAAERYRSQSQRAHYLSVSEDLYLWTEDAELSKAGLLHGVRDLDILARLPGGVEPAVETILEDRARLSSLDPNDRDMPRNLVQNVLPHLRDVRAGILVIIELLNHFDPHGEWRDFTLSFYTSPGPPPGVGRVPHSPGFARFEDQVAFLRTAVATMARHFGLWLERNRAEDIALFFTDRDRFDRIVTFVTRPDVKAEAAARVSAIHEALGGLRSELEDVRWEWHHAGSLDRRLPLSPSDHSASRLVNCGTVTVICKSREVCYAALGKLHLANNLSHQQLETRDYMNQAGLSGYEAIHTALTTQDGKAMQLRLIPAAAQRLRLQTIGADRLAKICAATGPGVGKSVRVFAFDGRPVTLPLGSTVLNFCYQLHSRLIAYATGAIVNRERVGLLHPLENGDVVRVEKGLEPRPLPQGWETKVPAGTVRPIAKAFKAGFQPLLLEAGRAEVRRRLREAETSVDDLECDSLDSFLEEAISRLTQTYPELQQESTAHWLRCFGRKDRASDEDILLDKILEETKSAIGRAGSLVTAETLAIPDEALGSFDSIVRCDRCSPSVGEPAVGVVVNRQLFIHKAKRRCANRGVRLTWRRLDYKAGCFVVEVNSRRGIAAEVLARAAAHGLDLIDLSGATMGPAWAVLRFQAQGLRRDAVEKLKETLLQLDGVLRVFGPGDPAIPALEGVLPPRRNVLQSIPSQAELYVVGPPITEDERFYGRANELTVLRNQFGALGGAPGAMVVSVLGPLRTGKTSLVLQFLRELQRTEYRAEVLQTRCLRQESWRTYASRISGMLEQTLRHAGLQPPPNAPLPSLINMFPDQLKRPLVIFVDEAIGMFLATQRESEGLPALLSFMRWLSTRKGLMLIWAGPEAPALKIHKDILGEFNKAQEIRLSALSVDETVALLAAAKLGDRGRKIAVDWELAKAVKGWTRGNPYWSNSLAQALLDSKPTRGVLRFCESDFDAASHDLINRPRLFSDRTEDPYADTPLAGAAPAMLWALAKKETSDLPHEALLRIGRERAPSIGGAHFSQLLDLLRAQGAIRSEDRTSWRLDSPALQEYIRTYGVGA